MSLSGSVFGRLTKDPEVKQSQNGKNYALISVAVNGGKNQDRTDKAATFINIKAFGKQGEIISQSFKKGHRIKADINQLEASAWINQQSGQAQSSMNAMLVGFDFVETKAEAEGQQGAPPQQQQNNSWGQQPPQNNLPPAQNGNWGNQQQGNNPPPMPPQKSPMQQQIITRVHGAKRSRGREIVPLLNR